jgi:hypothetical protein
VKAVYLYYSHRADKAIQTADAMLAINPNFGWGCEATPIFLPAISNKPNPIFCNR